MLFPLLALALSACQPEAVWAPVGETARSTAPYSPEAGADFADRDCTVALHDVARVSNGTGGTAVHVVDGQRYLVWEGHLDVALTALEEGAAPVVLFQYGAPQWWQTDAEPVEGAPAGYQRFAFWLEEHTPVEGMSTTSLSQSRIALIPALITAEGDRIFDHNAHADPYENYVLSMDNAWSYVASGACQPEGARPWAAIEFSPTWEELPHGTLIPGGDLRIEYDLLRLYQCFGDSYQGVATWNTVVYGRFLPGGELFSGSVVDCGSDPACGIPRSRPLLQGIPEGAEAVELWANTAGQSCGSTWDSNFDANYRFEMGDLPADPTWAGDVGYTLSRGMNLRTENPPDPLIINSWVLTRADLRTLDAEVYVPGITDRDGPATEIMARARVSRDGATPQEFWMNAVGRVDNNARFSWSLFNVDMTYTPWNEFLVEMAFSTDGLLWVAAPPVHLVRGSDWCPVSYWGSEWCPG